MKKLFLLILLFVGLASFSSYHPDKIENETEFSQTKVTNDWQIIMQIFNNESTLGCTATVYYNGEVQRVFTGIPPNPCADARKKACEYIESQGGNCPPAIEQPE